MARLGREVTTWIDLPTTPSDLAEGLGSLHRVLASLGELKLSKAYWIEAADKGTPPRFHSEECNSFEDLLRFIPTHVDSRLVEFHGGFRLGTEVVDKGGRAFHPSGVLSTAFELSDLVHETDMRRFYRFVPPHLFGRVYPLDLSFDMGEVGGAVGFKSPELKGVFESLWEGIVSEVRPTRMVDIVRPHDWRDERDAMAAYYLDPRDLAISLKLLWGFRAPVDELATVLVSDEFRHSLPRWRSSPHPNGAIPTKGVFLRFYAHTSEIDDHNDNPDGSMGIIDALKAELARQGIDARDDGRSWKDIAFDARWPPIPA